MKQIVECVPNFSEGRRSEVVSAIAGAVNGPDIVLLDQEMDADHNRSVLTFVGPPEAVVEAALRGAEKAVQLIDLRQHTGVHPRIGAVDVLPFVPVEGVTLEDCVRLAEQAGQEIWKRFGVPVYFYEAAARRPDRVNLENIRKGQFEGLSEEVLVDTAREPDVGGPRLHESAGATVVGARKFLIAYNINLGTADVEIARRIAKTVRFSSGGFRYVKAMGVPLESRGIAQVSMNLTDFEQTPVHRVFEAVRREAERYGVPVVGSEIVGLLPKKALEMTADFFLRCENFHPNLVLENRMADAGQRSGLGEFLDTLAAPRATPGGGSAAAAAGAMASALGVMVSKLSKRDDPDLEEDRRFFAGAVERDAAAYESVVAAYRRPKSERAPFVEEALHAAAAVPMEVAERSHALRGKLETLGRETPEKFASDLQTAAALCEAAFTGAAANVRINLASISDAAFRQEMEARLSALR
jgi:glutamate formiminotransferase